MMAAVGTPRNKPCMCSRQNVRVRGASMHGLGCGACCASRRGMGDYVYAGEGMGSWLSKAFKSVTGSKLSDVVGPAAGVIGSAIGGPVGGIIGGVVGGAVGGSGGSGTQLQLPASTGTIPGTQPGVGYNVNDIFGGVANVIAAARGETAYTAAVQAAQVANQPQQPAQNDTMKTVAIVGGVAAAGLLFAMVASRK